MGVELLWRPQSGPERQRGRFSVVPRPQKPSYFLTGADCRDSGTVWGALGHGINLNIPNFQMTDDIDEVRWERGSTLVAEFKRKMKPFLKSGAFEILANGDLKIKNLTRDDSGTYNVTVYSTNGTRILNKALDLRILGKSSFLKVFHFRTGAM